MNCQNNDIYKKAMEKIKNAPKPRGGCCCFGATGPTGPTGPTGAQGIQGVTGPTGPSPIINSILVSNDGIQSVVAGGLINLGTLINSTGTSATFTAPNTITLEAGTYYILYESLINNTSTSGDVGVSLQVNGTIVSNASEYVPATSTQTQIVLQHNITITDETAITVKNNSTVSNSYHDSSISIIKLG